MYPKMPKFAASLAADARTTQDQAALHFFMASHFVADACMPCHCDARKLSAYDSGIDPSLHHALETTWGNMVGAIFTNKALLTPGASISADDLMAAARKADDAIKPQFAKAVPALEDKDVWQDTVNVCRGSFTLASIMAPPGTYPYDGTATPTFAAVFGGMDVKQASDFHAAVLHDAVLNVATVWKHVWGEIAKAPAAAPAAASPDG